MAIQKRRGFTLIEMLAVVAIIGLLIAVLVPAVQAAQKRAKVVACRAQLAGIATGIKTFETDFGIGTLPDSASEPFFSGDTDNAVQGAHRLFFAMMGRDRLGTLAQYPDSIKGTYWVNKTTKAAATQYSDWGNSSFEQAPRKSKVPYVNPDQLFIVNDNSSGTNPNSYLWLFADKFCKKPTQTILSAEYGGWNPILYFRAASSGDNASQLYNPYDNWRIARATGDPVTPTQSSAYEKRFFWGSQGDYASNSSRGGIVNAAAKVVTIDTPYNKDSYLLISAGPDGEYFTDDDIVNWEK